jgi:RNA polymerase sigma factor (sigma-70 family)
MEVVCDNFFRLGENSVKRRPTIKVIECAVVGLTGHMNIISKKPHQPRRPLLAAMILGTAIGAFGTGQAVQAQNTEQTHQIVTDMSRYCTVCWRNARLHPDSWGDCTQEVFSRMLQRVAPTSWEQALRGEGEERREFLRAIDAVKKRTQRALRRSTSLNDELVADHREARSQDLVQQRELVSRAAAELLSPRQQRIMQLSFDGWSVQEIADEMQLPAERVSDEKYKGIRKLRATF